MMGVRRERLWQATTTLTIVGGLTALSVFTPIFANVGVFVLDVFSKTTLSINDDSPTAIVLLGGGLIKKDGKIALNHYTQSRADTAIGIHDGTMPIITSGVESPWLQDYIEEKHPQAFIISDNASMNTCENAIFTAKLLAHHELGESVYLVTDRYHMARARRQFAQAGISTIPQPAPLTIPLSWGNGHNNWVHSRRTIYEMMALARDILRPQNNCRMADEISLEEISTPRREPKIFF
ncbi:YdcF family protein [Moraxella nonliquefaciens]|nr:YdcF family protein [Moraxella nonliquefaciens]